MTKTAAEIKANKQAIAERRAHNKHKLKPLAKKVDGLEAKIKHQSELIAIATKKIKAGKEPLRVKAFNVAASLEGVVEQGGNNTGPVVDKIIHANGGVIGEPWCGDFVAYCYRAAGSKLVDRAWASVNAIQSGNNGDFIRTTNPAHGDVVTYSFSHTGIFDKWVDRSKGIFLSVEGNTGTIGAVSDSLTGGDGVYHKQRSTSLGVSFWKVAG